MKYYIKCEGRIYGPAEENKIAEKIASGFFSGSCMVSSDRENWEQIPPNLEAAAESVGSPAVGAPRADSNNAAPRRPSNAIPTLRPLRPGLRPAAPGRAKNRKWIVPVVIVGAVLFFAILLVVGIVLSWVLVAKSTPTSGANGRRGRIERKAYRGSPRAKSFEEVCAHYQSAVGVVVVTLEDAEGKLLTKIGDFPVDCDHPIGTAFAIGENEFVTNCHVAYSVKNAKSGALADILLKVYISEAKRQGVKSEEEFVEFCKKNREAIEKDRKYLQENIRVRKVEIRLAHSDGMTLPVTGVQIHPRYKTSSPTGEFDLAILHTAKNTPTYFKIADTDILYNLHQGQRIAYLGFPMENLADDGGLNLERPEATFKSGTINKITDFNNVHSDPRHNRSLTHDIPTVGGASGSPVFLENGEVIAVVWGANHNFDEAGKRTASAAQHNFAVRVDSLDAVKEEKVHDINDWLGEKGK